MTENINILENIDTVINSFINMYSTEYIIPDSLKFRINIVKDMKASVNEFMNRTNRRYIADDRDYNGTTCIPNTIDEETEIFISSKLIEDYKKNNWQFMCTLFHELTHAIDFYNYCSNFFQGDYNGMIGSSDAIGFHMWTEFNAKYKSYLLYSRLLRQCMKDNNLNVYVPTDGEVEMQNDYILKSLRNNNVDEIVYDIIQYLGRYYCWELDFCDDFIDGKMFPEVFNKELSPTLCSLYELLKQDNNSVLYYNRVDSLVRQLKGKIIKLGHEDGILS